LTQEVLYYTIAVIVNTYFEGRKPMSMFCKCGKKAMIIDSRYDREKRITRRRYRCPVDGTRWSTLEHEVAETHLVARMPVPVAVPVRSGCCVPIK
jgi:hypothetical protein